MLKLFIPLLISLTFLGCTDNEGTTPDPVILSAPTLEDSNATTPENSTSGKIVGSIEISSEGSSSINSITLSGTGSDNFTVSTSGVIRISNNTELDYESYKTYYLYARARNDIGSSENVRVIISITNIDEVAILEDTLLDIEENSPVGTEVGDIIIKTSGDSEISSIVLEGEGNEKFIVSNDGNIILDENASLDYESNTTYSLTATAKNRAGNSEKANITIQITNIPDVLVVLEDTNLSVYENSTEGVVVGAITILNAGDSEISDINLSGDGHDNFVVSTDGIIKVDNNASLDYEETTKYNLIAVATNAFGKSSDVNVTINIKDIIISLHDTNATVAENSNEGTVVGSIEITNPSNSEITKITLDGDGNENFVVTTEGVIKVDENASLDFETKELYNLNAVATYSEGDTQSVNIDINITDINDVAPTLNNTSGQISENSVENTEVTLENDLIKDNGDSEITKIKLSGEGYDKFSVSTTGVISVTDNAELDYETKSFYNLTAIATNDEGDSDSVDLNITLLNVENPFQIAKIQADDADNNDSFSTSVSLHGEYIVVGSPYDDKDSDTNNTGSIYLYQKSSDDSITQITKVTADDSTEDSLFGYAVSIYGNYIAASSLKDDDGAFDGGAVYLFKMENDEIKQVAKFYSDDIEDYDYFGSSVSLTDGYILVGASNEDSGADNAGSSYIFKIDSDDKVKQIAKIQADTQLENAYFGTSVSIDGNYSIIGAYGEETQTGSAYLFKRNSDDENNVTQLTKLQASDKADNDMFGISVSISKDYIAIGASGEDTTASNAGQAYIFKRNTDSDISQLTKIQASDASADSNFGNSISINNNYILVGASHKDKDTATQNSGGAYLFTIESDNVTELEKLQARYSAENDYFANSVAINGNDIVIGSYKEDTTKPNAGSAYIFNIEPIDKPYIYNISKVKDYSEEFSYTYIQDIDAERPNGGEIEFTLSGNDADLFTIKNNVLSFNDPVDYESANDSNSDNKYEITVTASNELDNKDIKESIISITDMKYLNLKSVTAKYSDDNDTFGNSVSINGDYIVVGSPKEDVPDEDDAGHSYLFKKQDNGAITQIAMLEANDPQSNDNFGNSISIDGDYIVVGAYKDVEAGDRVGCSYLFKRNSDDEDDVTQIAKFFADDKEVGDSFGESVFISGDYIAIGAPGEDTTEDDAGSVYIFKRNSDDNITQIAKIQADDANASDYFGISVSINGDYISVGALNNDDNGSNSGSAYLFKRNSDDDDNVTQIAKFIADDADSGDLFGGSIAIDGDYIIVGAQSENTTATDAGTAYLFKRNSDDDNNVTQIAKIQASDASENDHFGNSVSIDKDNILIGASNCDIEISTSQESKIIEDAGCSYIFHRNSDSEVVQISKNQVRDAQENDHFGQAVAIDNNLFVVGAHAQGKEKNNEGMVVVFIKDQE